MLIDQTPQPSDQTRDRYDERSYRPMAKFLSLSVAAQLESADAYLDFDDLTEYALEAAQLVNRAHYYGGSILEMQFTFDGRRYEVDSDEGEGTYIHDAGRVA